jgi:DNA adenine methylase
MKSDPFLRWVGGKRTFVSTLAPTINEYLDKTGGHYFEPFLGGGAMALALGREKMVLSDVLEDLVKTYEAVANAPVELVALLMKMAEWGTDAEHYYAIRATEPETFVEHGARMIYLNAHCFNGLWRMNQKGEMNAAYGKEPNRITESLLLRIHAAHEATRSAEIYESDFERIMKHATEEDLVYMDPPYDGTYVGYSEEGFCGLTQERLAAEVRAAHGRGVAFLSHNSDTEKVRSWYEQFTIINTAEKRAVNCDVNGRGKKRCVLITNRPELLQLYRAELAA